MSKTPEELVERIVDAIQQENKECGYSSLSALTLSKVMTRYIEKYGETLKPGNINPKGPVPPKGPPMGKLEIVK